MINVLFITSSDSKINNVSLSSALNNCNVVSVESTFDAIKQISSVNYDAVVIASNLQDIDIELFINLIRMNMKYVKIMLIHSLDGVLEEKLFEYDIDTIVNTIETERIVVLKLERFILELIGDLKNKIYDAKSEVEVDLETKTVKKSGKTVKLSTIEYELIEFMIKNTNKNLSRREIEKNVWGNNISDFDSRVIDVYILKIRRKLNVNNIVTVRGVGYTWKS